MRLKRLELFGFKSFAERVVLDFSEHTLVGIVGPNGCGKSNVVDSVRWALGEMRPTSLRGEGMADVIFKGSASRPPLGMAQVTLVVGNEDQALEARGPEVAVERRLYRDGEGEYRIDGDRVRLKDLRDMLFDTGLGSRGYAVLEQGKIDAVLSANPVQRRAIFEEAAGISRYRQRRHETELRLKRTEQDLVRVEDVMGEMRTRVRSLKIAAGKAERWRTMKEEWGLERTRLHRHRLRQLSGQLEQLGPRMAELEAELGTLREERGECERQTAEREAERARLVSELDRLSGEGARVAGERRAVEERGAQLTLRIEAWEKAAREEAERAQVLGALIDGLAQEAEAGLVDRARLAEELESAQAEAASRAGELRDLNREYRAVREAVQEQNDKVLACLHRRTEAQNSERHLSEGRAPAAERSQRALARLNEVDEQLAEIRGEAEQAEAEAGDACRDLERVETRGHELDAEIAELQEQRESARVRKNEAELERARLNSRIESLLDRSAERADLGRGAQRVLESVDAQEGPCRAEQLGGLVADVLRVDTRLARALDAALADRAGALVAQDVEGALAILEWLRTQEDGDSDQGSASVSLVLPRGIARRDLGPPPECGAQGGSLSGRLYDRVRCAAGTEALGRALLGDVMVVENLERALHCVQLHPGWRFVTPQGELVDAAGIVGGLREVLSGPVGRRSVAAELGDRIEVQQCRLHSAGEALSRLDQRLSALHESRARCLRERDAASKALAEVESRLRTARARENDLSASHVLLERECQSAREEVERLAREFEVAVQARGLAEQEFGRENELLSEKEEGRRALEERRELLARDESEVQIMATRLAGELAAIDRRAAELAQRIEESRSEIERAEQRGGEYETNASGGREEGAVLIERGRELAAEGQRLESSLEELRVGERRGREALEEMRRRVEGVQARLDRTSETLSQERLEEQRLSLACDELVRRAAEELELTADDLKDGFEPEPELLEPAGLDALEQHTSQLKVQLDRIGPVNLEAVHELDEAAARLDHLESQSGDLARARTKLNETIRKIDEESRRLFLETFEEVGENFRRIFRQLFGGGKAEVRMEEGVDVLEAGIEITARPPGREMLSIGLLSGGQRTMTALALLFAVFQARPSPFCVLDEVDAALDDANVDRFLGMLSEFRKTTQFIVVTHNKGTMAACQSLFGVTMETKGVSRFVSVELSDVDEFTGNGDGEVPQVAPPREAKPLDAESGERVVELQPSPAPDRAGKPEGQRAAVLESSPSDAPSLS